MLFPREKLWRITSSALAWSLGGAVLAVAGWALGQPLGKPIWLTLNSINLSDQHMDLSTAMVNEAPSYVSLFLVWQPGIAFLLGIALHYQDLRKQNAPASLNVALSGRQKQLSTAGMAFFTLLAAVVALAFYRALLSYEAGAPARAIYKKQAAEAPSMANLPDLKPMGLNEALILDNSSGEYSAGSPSLQTLRAFKPVRGDALVPSPAIIVYSVLYLRS